MTISLEKGIHIILESTSNGSNNLFYELCLDSIKKNNDFLFIFIPWFWHKEYKSNDISKWNPSKEWLSYKEEFNISLKQLHWAYLKNQILCKMTNENKDSGPSTYFKREFPSNYQEAFLNSAQDNTLIPLESLVRKSVELKNLNNINSSISPDLAIIRQKRLLQNGAKIVLGVDVARGGGDLSWIIDRQGDFLGFNLNEKVNINDTMQLAYWIAKHIQTIKPYKVFIDSGGLGIAVVDRLHELNYGNIVTPINFASRATNYNKFLNKRAEIWYLLKEFIENNGYIVNDTLLLKQISSIKGFYNLKGLFQLEDKAKVRSAIKQSPDGGDAAALTFSNINNSTIIKSSIIDTNYNPFSW